MSIAKFYKENKEAFHWLFLLLVVVRLLDLLPPFQSLDRYFLDAFSRLHARHAVSSEIYIVQITDQDYKERFNSTSPLKPEVVAEIIVSIQNMKPAVIGVDLDTGSEDWVKSVGDPALNKVLKSSNIVWAGVPTNLADLGKEGVPLEVDCPLGGDKSRIAATGGVPSVNQIGLVVLPQDNDGVVRGHRREFPSALLSCDQKRVPAPLEPFDVAVRKRCDGNDECKELLQRASSQPWPDRIIGIFKAAGVAPPKKEYVNFSGEKYAFPVVQSSEFTHAEAKATIGSNPMKGRIVLLGGSYAAARDDYWTPLGKMSGVELFATSIQSAAGEVLPADWPPVYVFAFLLDLLLGSLLIWLAYLSKHGKIPDWLAVSIGIGTPFILLYGSYRSNVWLGAGPIVAGVILDRVHDLWEDRAKWREKSEASEKALKKLEKQYRDLEEANEKLQASAAERHFKEREHTLRRYADGTVVEEDFEIDEDSGQQGEHQTPEDPHEENK